MNRVSILFLLLIAVSGCSKPTVEKVEIPKSVISQNIQQTKDVGEAFVGTVTAHTKSMLAFPISGTVASTDVKVGSLVKKGRILAKLNSEKAMFDLKTAEANLVVLQSQLNANQRSLDRVSGLFTDGFATKSTLEIVTRKHSSLSASLEQLKATRNRAQNLLSLSILNAPHDGIVTDIYAETGAVLSAGKPLLKIVSTNEREVVFSLTIQDIERLTKTTEFEVSLIAKKTIISQARLSSIDPVASRSTRTRAVYIQLIDPPQALRLGALVHVKIKTTSANHILLPKTALIKAQPKPSLWVVDRNTNRISIRKVKLGKISLDYVQILSGLEEGEEVILKGVNSVKEGQLVGKQVSQ